MLEEQVRKHVSNWREGILKQAEIDRCYQLGYRGYTVCQSEVGGVTELMRSYPRRCSEAMIVSLDAKFDVCRIYAFDQFGEESTIYDVNEKIGEARDADRWADEMIGALGKSLAPAALTPSK